MSNGDTTNLGPGAPQLESSAGPRFSVIDMGAMVGPERMDTMGMLKSELRSVYEDNSMVRSVSRAVADPGEALIALLKPLMILVAVVIGFVGAALLMESRASATSAAVATEVEAVQPVAPEPELIAAAVVEPAEEELAAEEEVAEETQPEEPEPAAAVASEEPTRKARYTNKRAKRKKHKKRKKGNRRRRR